MKILITGLGITGKSTFRRKLKEIYPWTVAIDGDYEEMPNFDESKTYIIEDVHALMSEACLPIDSYNLIIYLLPDLFTHTIFWLKRMWIWIENGEGSWDKKTQDWLGNRRRYDPANIPLFIKLMLQDLLKRRQWINEDVNLLSNLKNKIVLIPVRLGRKEIKYLIPTNFKPLG